MHWTDCSCACGTQLCWLICLYKPDNHVLHVQCCFSLCGQMVDDPACPVQGRQASIWGLLSHLRLTHPAAPALAGSHSHPQQEAPGHMLVSFPRHPGGSNSWQSPGHQQRKACAPLVHHRNPGVEPSNLQVALVQEHKQQRSASRGLAPGHRHPRREASASGSGASELGRFKRVVTASPAEQAPSAGYCRAATAPRAGWPCPAKCPEPEAAARARAAAIARLRQARLRCRQEQQQRQEVVVQQLSPRDRQLAAGQSRRPRLEQDPLPDTRESALCLYNA